jgi:CRISPR-associated protein Cas1
MNPLLYDPAPEVLYGMHALRRAWRIVRASGSSPGTDGIKLVDFEAQLEVELNRLRQQILNQTYQPQPVRRFYIQKAAGKQRPISLWAVRDRVAQRVIHDYLQPLLEGIFLPCSYGFRPERSRQQAVHAIVVGREQGLSWVVDADIADCFGSIPLPLLQHQLRRVVGSALVLKLLDQWLYAPIEGQRGQIAGVSQGGIISPLLANLYLHRFDEMLLAALPQTQLIRFADDFIILCRQESEAVWALEVARRSLENLQLKLNPRKTRLVHFEEGFTFLGTKFHHEQVQMQPTEPEEE